MKHLKSEWLTLLAFAVAFAAAGYLWPRVPDVLPVHWGPNGEPDRFGGKFEGLLLVPLLMLVAAALLLVVERFAPNGRANAAVLRTGRFGLALLAALLSVRLVFEWPVPRTALIGVGLLMLLLGNVTSKAQPSAFVGFRTPWTIASRRAWYASQRRSARWMTTFGLLLTVAAAVVPSAWLMPWVAPIGLLTVLPVMLTWLTYASYRDWRNDPSPEGALRHE